ncbi:hypothetical protein Fcan01_17463 [Folsomia candida]|uniref:Uncharacterized protein n=1 Tax=Folsomia candida TaxID=158441 RepID=A0A226DSF2_FOLCA|nr:hypothetical protein Fcan01_17463 [Folsomia candida]
MVFYLLQRAIESKLKNGYKLTPDLNTVQRNLSHRFTQEMFNVMVETKSCVTVAGTSFAYRKIDNDQFTALGVKCFFLPKQESVMINVFSAFKYFRADVVAEIMQRIDEAGIIVRWLALESYAKMFMLYVTQKAEFDEVDEFHKLDLASHLQILFYLWMIALMFAGFCFISGFASVVGGCVKSWYQKCIKFFGRPWRKHFRRKPFTRK